MMYILLLSIFSLLTLVINMMGLLRIDVREGASGASADAPGVGLEMVSDLKLLQKHKN